MNLDANRPARAAISTEMVIVLVLLAAFSILGFMYIGQQVRIHQKITTEKIGGQVSTGKRAGGLVTNGSGLDQSVDRNEMTGADLGTGEGAGAADASRQVNPIP